MKRKKNGFKQLFYRFDKAVCHNRQSGFSLLEMIVVVLILLTMLAIAVPYLSRYMKKYNTQKEITKIYSDLSLQRFKSMNTGIPHGIRFDSSTQYTIFTLDDKNYNLKFDGVSEEKDATTVTLKYPLNGIAPGSVIMFGDEGVARSSNWSFGSFTLYINYPARHNCIKVYISRIAMGEYNAGKCEVK